MRRIVTFLLIFSLWLAPLPALAEEGPAAEAEDVLLRLAAGDFASVYEDSDAAMQSALGDADGLAVRLSQIFTREVKAQRTPVHGFQMVPGLFSWANTLTMGATLGATPNGRRAGEPISHGANPNPGFRKDGALTAMSNSICAVQPGYGNTAPVQLELDPGMGRGEEAVQKIADYIMTLFEQGATLLNINIVNGQQILEADKDPSKYPNLVVRVTGFTAYFCSLTPEFRKLVVDRILIQG